MRISIIWWNGTAAESATLHHFPCPPRVGDYLIHNDGKRHIHGRVKEVCWDYEVTHSFLKGKRQEVTAQVYLVDVRVNGILVDGEQG